MPEPAISVLLPTYNRARYLKEAVASVLGQTYRDLEVVIVDDGSTDETPEIVRGFDDSRVRYIYQPNRGVSAALNTAWHAARGRYLARLDSDDAWLPDLLAELIPALEADESVGVVYARAQAMDTNGRTLPQIMGSAPRYPGRMLESLLYADCVCPIAVVLRASCLEQAGGYDESLPGTEDWDLWLRLAEHWKFVFSDKVLARYRFHAQNITGARSEHYARLLRDRERVLDMFYARPQVPAAALAMRPVAFRNLYLDLTIRQLSNGRYRQALESFKRTLRVAPNPAGTAVRVIGVALYYLYLSKTRTGVALVESLQARRRASAARVGK